MPFREFFRGLMGLPPQQPDMNNNRDPWANDVFCELFRDFRRLGEGSIYDGPQLHPPTDDRDPFEPWPPQQEERGAGFGPDIFRHTDDMFRHFEEQFRRTFQAFGMMDFPGGEYPSEFGAPPLEAPLSLPEGRERPGTSLRDRMLKPAPAPGLSECGPRADLDLDQHVSESGLSALLEDAVPSAEPPPRGMMPHHGFSSSTFSFSQHIGPDGRLEERRVETGAGGERRETITRRVGDQQQTTVTVQRPDGNVETEEHLTNLDQGDLPQFERLWRGGAAPSGSGDPRDRDDLPVTPHPRRPDLADSFWRSLFG